MSKQASSAKRQPHEASLQDQPPAKQHVDEAPTELERMKAELKAANARAEAAERATDEASELASLMNSLDRLLAKAVFKYTQDTPNGCQSVLAISREANSTTLDESLRQLIGLNPSNGVEQTEQALSMKYDAVLPEVFIEFHNKLRESPHVSNAATRVGVILEGCGMTRQAIDSMDDKHFNEKLSRDALCDLIDELPCKPDSWQAIDEEFLESFKVDDIRTAMKQALTSVQNKIDGAYDILRHELTTVLSSVSPPLGCDWLPRDSGSGNLTRDCVTSLVDVLLTLFKTAVKINSSADGAQQCEGNVDLAGPIPTVFGFFNDTHCIHVYKERKHHSHHVRESGKATARSSGATSQTIPIIKVDHAVELRSPSRSSRFTFGVGETAQKDDPIKQNDDTAKCHACSKAELCLLALHGDDSLQKLASTAFVFSCVCTGPRIEVFCYRISGGFVKATSLCSFTVPTTVASLSSAEWSHIMAGLLAALQLKHHVGKLAAELNEYKYSRPTVTHVTTSTKAAPPQHHFLRSTSRLTKAKGTGDQGDASASSSEAKTGKNLSPKEQCRDGLARHKLNVVIAQSCKRRNNTQLFFGFVSQRGQNPFEVAIKYIGNSGFRDEACMHQAAAGIAPEGVLPLWAWTDDVDAIAALKLEGLHERKDIKGGVMLMPLAKDWKYPKQRPLHFLTQVWQELCPTLQALARVGLYHHDLRQDNVVVWRGRLHLMDFGYSTWKSDCLNMRALECGEQYLQAPELKYWWHRTAPPEEPALVYTLGSLMLFALADDFERHLGVERSWATGFELLGSFRNLERLSEQELPAGWKHGLQLMVPMLQLFMSYWEDRPSLAGAIDELHRSLNLWHQALKSEELPSSSHDSFSEAHGSPELPLPL
eukprot:m.227406 g.227406  ORF g.227406 m.227406 type:complete len:880 (+) comp17325_c0_seq1:165-2804(+)